MERQVSPPTTGNPVSGQIESAMWNFDPELFRRFSVGESVHNPDRQVQVIRDTDAGIYGIIESPDDRRAAAAASRGLRGALEVDTPLSQKHGRQRFDVNRPMDSVRTAFKRAEETLRGVREKLPENEALKKEAFSAAATVIRFFRDGEATKMAYGHIGHGRLFRAQAGGMIERLTGDRTENDMLGGTGTAAEPQIGVVDVNSSDRFILMSDKSMNDKTPDLERIGEALSVRDPAEAAERLRHASGSTDDDQAVLVIDVPTEADMRGAGSVPLGADEQAVATGRENRLLDFARAPLQETGLYMTAGALAATSTLGMVWGGRRRRDARPTEGAPVEQRVVRDDGQAVTTERTVPRQGSSGLVDAERSGGTSKGLLAAVALGSAAVGALLTYVGMRESNNLPEWMAGDMGRYFDLENDGYEPTEIAAIMNDRPEFNPDLYADLQALGAEQDTIERIYQNLGLFERMIEADISYENAVEVFQDRELFDRYDFSGVATAELPAVVEYFDVYGELVAAGLTTEAAAEFVVYPELLNLWEQERESSPLIQSIIENDQLFDGLAEMGLTYERIREIMLNPEDFQEVLLLLADENLTADELIDLLNGEQATVTEVPEATDTDTPPQETVAPGEDETPEVVSTASDPFNVEYGHGYTHEIDDELETIGIDNPPAEDAAMHIRLIDKYGVDYLTGIPKYELPEGVWGEYGLANPGTAQWAPGVEADIHAWGKEYAAN